MIEITPKNVALFNENVRYEDPSEIIGFALQIAKQPVVTTSFGPYAAALLYACIDVQNSLPVIWCDTGFNTDATYAHVQYLRKKLSLNLDIFVPKFTTAYLKNTIGLPALDNPNHAAFSEKVKLEPFERAFEKYQPDVWFTNIRKHQTEHRRGLGVFSFSKEGILKVSPFFHYSDKELESYIKSNNLPLEFDYFDPVKALENRECGIHFK